ncbi:type II secretion system F family protein [Mycolicibacter sp. MYC123]|uniref:Type II secretion system F family protein n=1 Tax=[Mycobacterium] zoologicum TaxID=2872311 RepID=A0ABU5YEH3_9MYCO|nr:MULTISPECIES: type II secretion system F family protein [unclassified Mycolicibacter]MEB3048436.1 type II secretion system F family protein [Mycolicibacter sp. MYC123]MEB3065581.1 type II secretion system F family protein [Mycolicibacter sp. MYC101]
MMLATVLLAGAVLAAAGPSVVRVRAGMSPPVRVAASPAAPGTDALALAAGLDVFALCLTAGMPVSGAASATARSAPPQLAAVLRRGADLLALGADPAVAWSPPESATDALEPSTTAVLRLARRSGTSGAALAAGLGELAKASRDDAGHAATAAAERAGVLIAGPLGLCFLPAFVCLGIVPVVAGLAGEVLQSGLL